MVEAAALAMANHRAAAALLLMASLFVAVAISRADARPTVRPNKMAALRRDEHGRGIYAATYSDLSSKQSSGMKCICARASLSERLMSVHAK